MKKFLVTYHFGNNKFSQIEQHKNYSRAQFRANKRVLEEPFIVMEYEDGGKNIIYSRNVTNVTINEVKR